MKLSRLSADLMFIQRKRVRDRQTDRQTDRQRVWEYVCVRVWDE